ncbi:unnamed protein product, partial [Hapterophycus canaliculatus]
PQVKWLHANRNEGCSSLAMDGAAEHGRLEVLEWLRRNRPEGWTLRGGAQAAARNGELAALSYLLLGGKGNAVQDFDDGGGGFGALDARLSGHRMRGVRGSGGSGGEGDGSRGCGAGCSPVSDPIDGLRLAGGGGIAPAWRVTLDLDEAAAEGRLAVLEWARRATIRGDVVEISYCSSPSCCDSSSSTPLPRSAGEGNGPRAVPGVEPSEACSFKSSHEFCSFLCCGCGCCSCCGGGQRENGPSGEGKCGEEKRGRDKNLPLDRCFARDDGGDEKKEGEDRDGRKEDVADSLRTSDAPGRDYSYGDAEKKADTEKEQAEPDERGGENEEEAKECAHCPPRCCCCCRCGRRSGTGAAGKRLRRGNERDDSILLPSATSPAPSTRAAATAATMPPLPTPPSAPSHPSAGASDACCKRARRAAEDDSTGATDDNGWRGRRGVCHSRERERAVRGGGVSEGVFRGEGPRRGGAHGRVASGAGTNRFRVAFTTAAVDGAAAKGHLEVIRWLYHHRREGGTSAALEAAAANGHANILDWLTRNMPPGPSDENEAPREKRSILYPSALDRAAANGHLGVVRWFHRRDALKGYMYTAAAADDFTYRLMDEAASNGHLQICRWLCEHRREGCSWNAFDGAAAGGHTHVLDWLRGSYHGVGPSAVAFAK